MYEATRAPAGARRRRGFVVCIAGVRAFQLSDRIFETYMKALENVDRAVIPCLAFGSQARWIRVTLFSLHGWASCEMFKRETDHVSLHTILTARGRAAIEQDTVQMCSVFRHRYLQETSHCGSSGYTYRASVYHTCHHRARCPGSCPIHTAHITCCLAWVAPAAASRHHS